MVLAIDLHELADAVPPVAWLVHGLEPLPPVPPNTVRQHPLPDGLDPEMDHRRTTPLRNAMCHHVVGRAAPVVVPLTVPRLAVPPAPAAVLP